MGSERKSVLPRSRVELHIHLDGAIRPETALDCARKREIHHVIEDLEKCCKNPGGFTFSHLNEFLRYFHLVTCPVAGDEESLRRIAYEFCEDAAKEGLLYCEVRYCPHLFGNTMPDPVYAIPGDLTPARVVEVISEGFNQGMDKFGVKIRSILSCMRHRPEWAEEVLELCVKYRESGVVAIDVAGVEEMDPSDPHHQHHIQVFQKAERIGVNRTVHAGEVGPAAYVFEAVDKMKAQRVGHGYSSIDDDAIYRRVLKQDMHLEICPCSSISLKSLTKPGLTKLLSKLVSDKANISINRDDPTMFNNSLTDDYELVKSLGMTDVQIVQANFDAARSAFLPEEEKKDLIEQLKEACDEETLKQIRF